MKIRKEKGVEGVPEDPIIGEGRRSIHNGGGAAGGEGRARRQPGERDRKSVV